MRFASFKDTRIEATPGAHGYCPGCGAEMIPRCGTKKVWHWAHRGQRHCDHWWENETEWHREWKNRFPTEWQEVPARDEHGELHIADIKTPNGLVVEFQYSFIKSEEAQVRTKFHAPMFWVVSGLRRPTDRSQFKEAIRYGRRHQTNDGVIDEPWVGDARLLKEWSGLGVMVAFDLGGDSVWLMRRIRRQNVLGFEYPKTKLVEHIREGTAFPDILYGQPQLRRRRRRLPQQPQRRVGWTVKQRL
jgi:competence protein CoiA